MKRNLILCLLVALGLRLAFVGIGFPYLEQRMQLRDDSDGYGLIAQSIREGRYDDMTRGPVYPVLLALAGGPVAMKLLQAVLDTVTCWLVWRLAGGRPWAAWLWALYPFAIWRVAFLNKETVIAFLVTAYLVAQVRALRGGRFAWWLGAGTLLGLLNLCKPMFMLWPVVLLLVCCRGRERVLTLAAAVAMCALIVPWTIRNARLSGQWLLVATERGGFTTFVGNHQATLGLWEGKGKAQWMIATDAVRQRHPGASVAELDRAYYRAAWQQAAAAPLKAVELVARKCWRFWFLSAAQREIVVSFVIQAVYLALAGAGLWRCRPWGRETVLLVALLGYVMVAHALSYADLRFCLPVMPVVCLLASGTKPCPGRGVMQP